ncbi:MAG: DUF5130 family protein [Acidimicrobiia bacterium]
MGRAVDAAEERTGLQFVVYLGPAGPDAHDRAVALLDPGGTGAHPDVVLLVAPEARAVEIVTAPAVVARIPDEACAAAIERMVPHLRRRRYSRAIATAVTHLAEVAGPGVAGPGAVELPDVVDDR